MGKEAFNSISLLGRSARNHQQFIKPAAREEPSMYAGKVESIAFTTVGDMYGVSVKDIRNKSGVIRATTAFNLQWRAIDEVLDETKYTTDPVTPDDLQTTPVMHKYAGRMVTGNEGLGIALDSIASLIPGNDPSSRQRRDRLEEILTLYTEQVADTANNPKYHQGEVLVYPTALEAKYDITGYLGGTAAEAFALLVDLPEDQRSIEFYYGLMTAMQFGDDYMDWRKDWNDYNKRKAESNKQVRPKENLLIATLEEFPLEKSACEEVLQETERRATLWLAELAPNTLDLYRHRFQTLLDSLPLHPQGEKLKGIVAYTLDKILPHVPESGWFAEWAKY